ncbi:MAG: hypothetical protein JKY30_05655, partial [Flavobacteriales bacterium]|nr:hypothetical protein [Flavobacteriales bacterium]
MGKIVYRITILIGVFFIVSSALQAQVSLPPLERTITLDLSGSTIKEVLVKIEHEAAFSFAYRSSLIDKTSRLTRSYVNKTVREILDDIFQTELGYKQKGNYVILRTRSKLNQREISIEGYFIDAQTKDKVPFVSIFDSVSLSSAVSDEYGYYLLKLNKKDSFNISTRKNGYLNKSISLSKIDGSQVLNIQMDPIDMADIIKKDTLTFMQKLKSIKLFKPSSKQEANLRNIKKPLSQKAQISILPYIGTNGQLSASTKVDYSLNIWGGVNAGVRKAEIAGFFNLNWDSVSHFQAAGWFNSVGGPQKGFQIAGLANLNSSSFDGVQVGGLFNRAKSFNGIQVGGLVNNIADTSRGLQVAGLVNMVNRTHRGVQVAGIINYAKKVEGVQIGLINLNDTISGVSIGFFNYSRKGYHQLEISADEIFQSNISFKTGTHRFYNTFTAGYRFNDNLWMYGYGIGTSFKTSKKSRFFLDLQATNIQQADQVDYKAFNLLNKLTLSYNFKLFSKVSMAIGPSYNVFLIEDSNTERGTTLKNISPHSFYNSTN